MAVESIPEILDVIERGAKETLDLTEITYEKVWTEFKKCLREVLAADSHGNTSGFRRRVERTIAQLLRIFEDVSTEASCSWYGYGPEQKCWLEKATICLKKEWALE